LWSSIEMDEHINDPDLFSLLEGIIRPKKLGQMKTHLSTCSSCETRYRSAKQFLSLLEQSLPETATEDVPEHLIGWALDRIPVRAVPPETASPLKGLTGHIKRLVAALSPIPPELTFARGTSDTLRLLYTVEGIEIPLCAFPSDPGGRWTLVGRVTGSSGKWEVSLHRENEKVSTCSIDPDKEFLFPGLLPGEYRLTLLTSPDTAIDIPPFQIG
jgi:hypothetical protein